MGDTRQLRSQAASHLAARRFAEAEAAYGQLLAKAPQDFEAHHKLGIIKLQTGAAEEGRRMLAAALALDPGHAEARMHHGMALQNLGRAAEAADEYRHAIVLKPDFPEALFQLGAVLRYLGRTREALSAHERCAELAPLQPHVFLQRGGTRLLLEDMEGALADFDRALLLQQDAAAAGKPVPASRTVEALLQRALTLEKLARTAEALAGYEQVLTLAPGQADAWSNRGSLLRKLERPEDAEASFRRALALDPRHVPARTNRGVVLSMLGRDAEAMADFRHLLEIAPANPHALGGLLAAALPLCDWDTVEQIAPRLASDAAEGRAIIAPFHMMLAFSDPRLLQEATAHFRRECLPPVAPRPSLRPGLGPGGGRIRIAYVSADFQAHATAYLMADLFERHNRARFEVIGVSYGDDDQGNLRARLRRGFDQFLDVQNLSDAQTAALLRDMAVDIAVDLKGFTRGGRSEIFAHGAAPVQVSYLGYPGTMAADFYDYVLADPVVLPHVEQSFWDEKIVHLPDSYQVNDPTRPHDPPITRAEAGLPESGFVFGCFNNHRKIARSQFDIWMRLLAATPGSVLWLLDDSANAALRAHAAAKGIDHARLIFAPKLDIEIHLRRLPNADLILDTLPCNAHTTASDALWMCVPILTCRGTTFAGRVAASLLTAFECPELIAETPADYEAMALALAHDTARLTALKAKLAQKRLTAPLFDAARFCRHLELAYDTMMDIARAGQAPRPFDVLKVDS